MFRFCLCLCALLGLLLLGCLLTPTTEASPLQTLGLHNEVVEATPVAVSNHLTATIYQTDHGSKREGLRPLSRFGDALNERPRLFRRDTGGRAFGRFRGC